MEAIMSINWKDLLSRAAWTFIQAFIACFIVEGESFIDLIFNGDWSALLTLFIATFIAATAAGLSALKTLLIELFRQFKIWWDNRAK